MYQQQRDGETNSFGTQSATISAAATYHILGDLRRRIVLRRLATGDTPLALDDLIIAVAEQEPESDITDNRHSIRVGLLQRHLPALDEVEALQTDELERQYRPGPNHQPLVSIINYIDEWTTSGEFTHDDRQKQQREGGHR
jgi:hypothetical protein